MQQDIRWQQRLENFEKAFDMLNKALSIKSPSDVERAGLIQFYEMAFELSWKTMKDYLAYQGYSTNSPRDTIKQSFQSELITNGHLWLQALSDRNLTVHTYDEKKAKAVEKSIRDDYYPLIQTLITRLRLEAKQ